MIPWASAAEERMKKYDYAILIGRFQPFHRGHLALFEHAAALASHVIVVIGSHLVSPSLRNPFSSSQREAFVRSSLNAFDPETYTIIHIRDSAYNISEWRMRLRRAIDGIAGGGRIALVGHFRDSSSAYLDGFQGWALETPGEQCGGISSTKIRSALFEGRLDDIAPLCEDAIMPALREWCFCEEYTRLRDEYYFVQESRNEWKTSPYPPVFVTADAFCTAAGRVLMIRRNGQPGRGQLALPGGFINQDEPVRDACIRELLEETAIEVPARELAGSIRASSYFDAPWRDARGRMITHVFHIALDRDEVPAVKGGDDAAEALWIDLSKIDSLSEEIFADHWQVINWFINRL